MPPTFKPDIQRILLKKKSQNLNTKNIYGTITLYGAKIPNKLQLKSKKAL